MRCGRCLRRKTLSRLLICRGLIVMTRVYPRSVRADKRIKTAIGVHTICICYLHTFATSSGIAMKAEKSVYIAITVSRSACFTTTHRRTLANCHDACAWRSPALFIVDHLMSKCPMILSFQNSQEWYPCSTQLFQQAGAR